jgi:hypothetical protein
MAVPGVWFYGKPGGSSFEISKQARSRHNGKPDYAVYALPWREAQKIEIQFCIGHLNANTGMEGKI